MNVTPQRCATVILLFAPSFLLILAASANLGAFQMLVQLLHQHMPLCQAQRQVHLKFIDQLAAEPTQPSDIQQFLEAS